MLDRLDIQIEVPALTSDEMLRAACGEPSAVVRERVLEARERHAVRGTLNALLANAALAVHRGGMSARGVHRALRVARTIDDLAGEGRVSALRLAEALQYRGV